MKFFSIITLFVFVNFMALPGIAKLMDWDIAPVAIMMNEEETHSFGFQLFEKTIPKTLNVHDFIKFFETNTHKKFSFANDDKLRVQPDISVISPPPEA